MTILELLPAVDVADGKAVRLVQGEAGSETSYGDPVEAALLWQQGGAEWVHLVDLDAAFGRGSNRELLARVVGTLDVKVEMSGGIRDEASLEAALDFLPNNPLTSAFVLVRGSRLVLWSGVT